MSRTHKPGTVELTGTGKLFYTNSRGEKEPFDRARFRNERPWARRSGPADMREMVL